MDKLKPSENLTPLAMFGMIILGNTAINVAHICSVIENTPQDEPSSFWFEIELVNGHVIDLREQFAIEFRDQLQTMLRHAQFAAPAGGSLIKH
jgi:hypothetical protein